MATSRIAFQRSARPASLARRMSAAIRFKDKKPDNRPVKQITNFPLAHRSRLVLERRWKGLVVVLPPNVVSPRPECPVQVEGGTNQSQVRERLGEVAQGFTAAARLLSVKAEVVAITEHLLEEQACLLQESRVGMAGAGQGLNQPEGAHVEGALAARQAVRCRGGIVTVAEAVRGKAARG